MAPGPGAAGRSTIFAPRTSKRSKCIAICASCRPSSSVGASAAADSWWWGSTEPKPAAARRPRPFPGNTMNDPTSRRELLARGAAATLGAVALPLFRIAAPPPVPMMVYKDPGCGCCEKWVGIMKTSGFTVSVENTTGMPAIKRRYGVSDDLASCHTALAGGYIIEGHVPADVIHRLLEKKPKVKGLVVPGMVIGSPGMEGNPKQAYDVLTFDAAGHTTVYEKR